MTYKTNYLLVILDDVRYDVYNSIEFDNLPNNAEKAYSPACWTFPSLMSILSGYPPIGIEKLPFDIGENKGWVPKKLKDRGYKTSIHSANGWLKVYEKQFSEGFDNFDIDVDKTRTHEYTDLEYEQPFFKVIHILNAHSPVWDGENVWEYSDSKYDNIKVMKKALKYVDEKFGEIIEDVPENTEIIVLSDHGELFGENGQYGHSPQKIDDIDEKLFEIPYCRLKPDR